MNHIETRIKTYITQNSAIFKKLLGNRDVKPERVNNIIKSINDCGYVVSPIIVNEKMEIIDGQARVEALTKLKLPIYYQVVKGIGLRECVAMNLKQSNWKTEDYIHSYAKQLGENSEHYAHLEVAMEEYQGSIPLTNIASILGRLSPSNVNKYIKNGSFTVINIPKALHVYQFFLNNKNVLESKNLYTTNGLYVIGELVLNEWIDEKRLIDKIKVYPEPFLKGTQTIDTVLEYLQDAYNSGRLTKNNTPEFFRDKFKAFMLNKGQTRKELK